MAQCRNQRWFFNRLFFCFSVVLVTYVLKILFPVLSGGVRCTVIGLASWTGNEGTKIACVIDVIFPMVLMITSRIITAQTWPLFCLSWESREPWICCSSHLHAVFVSQYSQQLDKCCGYCGRPNPFPFLFSSISFTPHTSQVPGHLASQAFTHLTVDGSRGDESEKV